MFQKHLTTALCSKIQEINLQIITYSHLCLLRWDKRNLSNLASVKFSFFILPSWRVLMFPSPLPSSLAFLRSALFPLSLSFSLLVLCYTSHSFRLFVWVGRGSVGEGAVGRSCPGRTDGHPRNASPPHTWDTANSVASQCHRMWGREEEGRGKHLA